jgi:hypothetical protein
MFIHFSTRLYQNADVNQEKRAILFISAGKAGRCEGSGKDRGEQTSFSHAHRNLEIYHSANCFDVKWRRGQDSNLQAITRGSFQDYCLTN